MAPHPPLDLFTDKEREVASILLEVSSIFLDSSPQVPFEEIRWGTTRRRTQPSYKFNPEPDRDEPAGPTFSDEEKRKGGEETASPDTPLCFPTSGSEDQIVTPPVRQVKKSNCQKDRLKEKKEKIAALSKEKADLSRFQELVELQEKFQRLCAMKFYLRNQNSKLLAQAEVRAINQLRPVGPTQSTNGSVILVKPPQWAPQPPPLFPPTIERRKLELDLNEEPADDVAMYVTEVPLTCHYDRVDQAARSAEARKRRLEIQRERRISSTQKRPRVLR